MFSIFRFAPPTALQLGTNALNLVNYYIEVSVIRILYKLKDFDNTLI